MEDQVKTLWHIGSIEARSRSLIDRHIVMADARRLEMEGIVSSLKVVRLVGLQGALLTSLSPGSAVALPSTRSP